MAKVFIKKLLEGNLPLTDTDFTMSFTDEGSLYITKGDGSQLKISSLITDYTNLLDLTTQNPQLENKLYLTQDHKLYVYDGVKYVSISGDGGQGLNTDTLNMLLELESKTDTFGYSVDGDITSVGRVYVNPNLTDENTVYSYDAQGNIIKEELTKMGKNIVNTFSYNVDGDIVEIKTVVTDI